jgi:hypothetical protein
MLIARFTVLGPLCLVIWMLVLPVYSQGIGSASGIVLRFAFGYPVESVHMEPFEPGPEGEGMSGRMVRRVQSSMDRKMVFTINGAPKPFRKVAEYFINIAPFVALALASVGISFRRRVAMLAIGISLIALAHVAFVVAAVYWAVHFALSPNIYITVGMLLITMPFLLWIVMGYGDRLMRLTLLDDNDVREG